MSATDYEIYSAAGELIYTSPHLDLARRWARSNAGQYPGLYLESVTPLRQRIWTDRAHMAASIAASQVAA